MVQLLRDIDNQKNIALENKPDNIQRENEGDEFRSSVNGTTFLEIHVDQN